MWHASKLLRKVERVRLRTVFYTFALSFFGLLFMTSIFMNRTLGRMDKIPGIGSFFPLSSKLRRKSIVIIVSQRRSGTTFMGKIFSQKLGAFYLFEPLMPFGINCNVLEEERIAALTKILDCDFTHLSSDYEHALQITRYPDSHAKCLRNAVCFSDKNGHLLQDYAAICNYQSGEGGKEKFTPNSDTCGYPLKPDILSQVCNSASIIAVKVVRICSLKTLEPLYRSLTDKGARVFVIHLVRDPRAVIFSTLELGLEGFNATKVKQESMNTCHQHKENLDYVDAILNSNTGASKGNFVYDGRYVRIRFEDLASNAVETARNIYKFIGSELPDEVEHAIRNSQYNRFDVFQVAKYGSDAKARQKAQAILVGMTHPFGTIRDPRQVLQRWRSFFSFDLVKIVQKECQRAMNAFGYVTLNSSNDFWNIASPVF